MADVNTGDKEEADSGKYFDFIRSHNPHLKVLLLKTPNPHLRSQM